MVDYDFYWFLNNFKVKFKTKLILKVVNAKKIIYLLSYQKKIQNLVEYAPPNLCCIKL